MTEAINLQTPDYLRGLSDGFKEGFNTALEQLHFLSQQQSIRIEMSAEKLEEIKKAINEIPMPMEIFNPEDWAKKYKEEHEVIWNWYTDYCLKKPGRE